MCTRSVLSNGLRPAPLGVSERAARHAVQAQRAVGEHEQLPRMLHHCRPADYGVLNRWRRIT